MVSMAFVTSPKDFLERIVTRLQVKAFFVVVCALIFSSPFAFLLSGMNTPFDSAFFKARRVHEISLQLIKVLSSNLTAEANPRSAFTSNPFNF
jgi:hypothetical protein